jgi:hypothetical protein
LGFEKAKREQIKLKIALMAPSGAGKTYGALRLAKGFGGRTAFIDTENKRGKYYANEFDYDYLEIKPPYTPEKYIDAIDEALNEGYDNIIVDSTSHEWMGKGGILEIKNTMPGANDYVKWAVLTPRHNRFLDKLIFSDANVIMCLRGKDEYILETNDKGKQVPRKVGLGAQQRDGIEYECSAAFMIDQDSHVAQVMKDNTHIFDGTRGEKLYEMLTEEHGKAMMEWANSGEAVVPKPKQEKPKIVPSSEVKADKANDEQWEAIIELMKQLGYGKEKMAEIMKEKTNKDNSTDLTFDDANVIIEYLGSLQQSQG